MISAIRNLHFVVEGKDIRRIRKLRLPARTPAAVSGDLFNHLYPSLLLLAVVLNEVTATGQDSIHIIIEQ